MLTFYRIARWKRLEAIAIAGTEGEAWAEMRTKPSERGGVGCFCCKSRCKSLIQNRLTVGYCAHFARFCATFAAFRGLLAAKLGEWVAQTDKFAHILRFLGIILRRTAQEQFARIEIGLLTDWIPGS
jgi:hypothetical protein